MFADDMTSSIDLHGNLSVVFAEVSTAWFLRLLLSMDGMSNISLKSAEIHNIPNMFDLERH